MVLLSPNGRHVVVGDTVNEPQPPTANMVEDLFKEWGAYYRPFWANCREEETYYFSENQVPVPSEMAIDPVRPATAHAIINVATDHVDISNPTIFVPSPSPRAQDRGERIQKFLQGFWMQIASKVLRTAVRQEYAYGITFLKLMWEPDQWPDQPLLGEFDGEEEFREATREFLRARSIAFPFKVININPKNLIWDDSRTGMKWAIEFYEAPAGVLRKMYPEWQSRFGNQEMMTFLMYWDDKWHGRMINGQWVWGPHEHGYGFNPIVPVIPANSLDFDVGLPTRRYQGILRPVHNLLDTEARLLTQYEAILRQSSWRTLDFTGPPGQADRARDQYEQFAAMNLLSPAVTVQASPSVTPPQEILSQLGNVQSLIEAATFPNVVRGMRPTGASSGFEVSVLAGTGRLVFTPYADGMSWAMQELNKRVLMLIENKALGRVTVRARSFVHSFDQTIGPDDIRNFYENTVKLRAESPEESERISILAERLWAGGNGLISLSEAQRRVGITSPLEEQNQMAAERLLAMAIEQFGLEQISEAINLGGQRATAAGLPPSAGNTGNQFSPGLPQLQRIGEGNIQQARSASQAGRPSVFPQGVGALQGLAGRLTGAPGGAQGVPSGQTIR